MDQAILLGFLLFFVLPGLVAFVILPLLGIYPTQWLLEALLAWCAATILRDAVVYAKSLKKGDSRGAL